MNHKSQGMKLPFQIKPGCLIVLEGLDATGKSTQHESMERACMGMGHGPAPLFDPAPLFLHMPSAGTELGQAIYEMTEDINTELDPLARQFLHLASHAQSVNTLIKPALAEGTPVILDRWWWSTVAYGWYGSIRGSDVDRRDFNAAINTVWGGLKPDLIAVFMYPHQTDHHNTKRVANGYKHLCADTPYKTVHIEPGDVNSQGEQLYAAMVDRGIYKSG